MCLCWLVGTFYGWVWVGVHFLWVGMGGFELLMSGCELVWVGSQNDKTDCKHLKQTNYFAQQKFNRQTENGENVSSLQVVKVALVQ